MHNVLTQLNPKETSWGLKGPVAYISYHCVSLKNRFLLKRYVFLRNIVLHNIICETNWIVITTKFYRQFCEKVTQKTETGLLGPGPSLCVIQTKWHIYKKMPYIQNVQYQSYIPQFSTKGPSYMVTMDRWQRYSENYRVKKARFGPLCKSCPRIIEKCIFICCE